MFVTLEFTFTFVIGNLPCPGKKKVNEWGHAIAIGMGIGWWWRVRLSTWSMTKPATLSTSVLTQQAE